MLKADLFLIFPPLLVTFYIFSNKANVLFLTWRKMMPFITGTRSSEWKRANAASWPLSLESSAASLAAVWELGFHESSHDFLSDEYSSLCLHHADNEVHIQHFYFFWVLAFQHTAGRWFLSDHSQGDTELWIARQLPGQKPLHVSPRRLESKHALWFSGESGVCVLLHPASFLW